MTTEKSEAAGTPRPWYVRFSLVRTPQRQLPWFGTGGMLASIAYLYAATIDADEVDRIIHGVFGAVLLVGGLCTWGTIRWLAAQGEREGFWGEPRPKSAALYSFMAGFSALLTWDKVSDVTDLLAGRDFARLGGVVLWITLTCYLSWCFVMRLRSTAAGE